MDNKNILEMIDQIRALIEARVEQTREDEKKEICESMKTYQVGKRVGMNECLIIISEAIMNHDFNNDRQIAMDLVLGVDNHEK